MNHRSRCEAMLTCGNTKMFFVQKTSTARCTENATETCGKHRFCWVHARAFQNPNRASKLEVCREIDGTPPKELGQ